MCDDSFVFYLCIICRWHILLRQQTKLGEESSTTISSICRNKDFLSALWDRKGNEIVEGKETSEVPTKSSQKQNHARFSDIVEPVAKKQKTNVENHDEDLQLPSTVHDAEASKFEYTNFSNITQMLATALGGNIDDKLKDLEDSIEIMDNNPKSANEPSDIETNAQKQPSFNGGLFASVMAGAVK